MDWESLSALELAAAVRDGRVTARQAVEQAITRAQRNSHLNAFITIDTENALAQAASVDEQVSRGLDPGPLAGVPVAVKDNIATEGVRTTAGSRALENYVPPKDATVISRLREAGAVIVGKTNMDEFGMGSTGEFSAFGPVGNPVAPGRVPGGSSGGSAAAVAAGIVPLALGTDTGGSVRQPAAFCGVIGYKPTYGVLSRWGVISYASSLDQVGVLARHTDDIELALDVMGGPDPLDSTSISSRLESTQGQARERPRVGIIRQLSGEGNSPAVLAALERTTNVLRTMGLTVEEVDIPHARFGIATYYLVAMSEASSNLSRYDGTLYGHRQGANGNGQAAVMMTTRGRSLGEEVRRRILMGTYALSAGYYDAYYGKALKVRRLIANDFARAFERFDILLSPVAPTPPFPAGNEAKSALEVYLGDVDTCLANLAGLPAISIPVGRSEDGLPISVQLMAAPLADAGLLAAAKTIRANLN